MARQGGRSIKAISDTEVMREGITRVVNEFKEASAKGG
jgi:hypothetical protein